MLKPEQLDKSFLDGPDQLPYIIRFAEFTAASSNISNLRIFEANFAQNPNNPWIHHSPISPTSPVPWTPSVEQLPNPPTGVANDVLSVSGSPHAPPASGLFPGVGLTDEQVICWTSNSLPWNLPLFFRWWVHPSAAGHITAYDFLVGQFCIRCGPTVVEVFKDISPNKSRLQWQSQVRLPLFSGSVQESTASFGSVIGSHIVSWLGHPRALLWLPYRRNYVYLESSYGQSGVFKANPFTVYNGLTGSQSDWGIVESRNLIVGGLTAGPGLFQIQRVKFADGPAQFNLQPFTTDYEPSPTPAQNWLVDDRDIPQNSTLTHTTPASPPPYTFVTNDIDSHDAPMTDPNDQTRTYGSVYTLNPGTDPTNTSRKCYTPFLYGVEARIPNNVVTWPHAATTISDSSGPRPKAWVKRADISASLGDPGHFSADVEDVGESLVSYYFRSEFPLQFADANGHPSDRTMWTTLWSGVADPVQTEELRLDQGAPREMRISGTDYWKWLNQAVVRDNRDWTGFGHITTLQSLIKQAGISVAGWDGPAPGTIIQQEVYGQIVDVFKPDAAGYDTELEGPLQDQPSAADGTQDQQKSQPINSPWRAQPSPPDTYGSFIKRIAELWSGWDYGFERDGTFYYHPFGYYSTSEMTFFKDTSHAQSLPHYFRGSVRYDPLYPDANFVAVLGATSGGSLKVSTLYVDFPSLTNPNAVNFMGKERDLLALRGAVPGAQTDASRDKVARAIFERARRRRLRVHFRGTYVPTLKIGHCHSLEGIQGVWRLQSVRASYTRQGWDTAEFESELVEVGHN